MRFLLLNYFNGSYAELKANTISKLRTENRQLPVSFTDHPQHKTGSLDVVASAFNPGTWEARQIDLWDIKDSLGYTVSSKTNKGYIVKSIFKKKK